MLLLTAPAQHIAQNPAVECDPRRVRHWLATLPTNDVQTTVHQLLDALKPFNELQLDVKTRLKLLEIYHKAFDTILYTFDELHLRSLELSQGHRRQLSDDIMWVYLELANGYKSIVKAVYEGSQDLPSQGEIQLAIYRGIELIAYALIYAFRDHRTPPPLAYLEIHQLYYLAEQYQIEIQPVSSLCNKSRNPSIQQLYKQIMLLIAADAYAYNGCQVSELYELLARYTNECQLISQQDTASTAAGLFIDFNEDCGPRSSQSHAIQSLLPGQRLLKVDAVIQQIVADLNKAKHQSLNSIRAGELHLLRLFINKLLRNDRNSETRQQLSGVARVAYALEASGYYLQHRDRFLDAGVESADGIEVRDIDPFEAEHELSIWRIENATSNGLRLSTDYGAVGHFIAGEVVSIADTRSATQDIPVKTGLIRWLRHLDDKVHIGVEFLAGLPMAVACQTMPADNSEPFAFTGLYYPGNQTSKQPASLLFEYNYLSYANKFNVKVAGRDYIIEPVKFLNESPVHIQFGFRILNS